MSVLVDTGPIVALLDRSDAHHGAVVTAWKTLRRPPVTVWPVITEASHLLSPDASAAVLEFLESGAIRIVQLGVDDVPRVRDLMRKYAEIPMDFADACLVRVGERDEIRTVFTLDRRGFTVFAPKHTRRFRLLPRKLARDA